MDRMTYIENVLRQRNYQWHSKFWRRFNEVTHWAAFLIFILGYVLLLMDGVWGWNGWEDSGLLVLMLSALLLNLSTTQENTLLKKHYDHLKNGGTSPESKDNTNELKAIMESKSYRYSLLALLVPTAILALVHALGDAIPRLWPVLQWPLIALLTVAAGLVVRKYGRVRQNIEDFEAGKGT